jgi:DNA-binding response OmpR family regulator
MAIAKVLLVDDDENALSGLAELLEYKGFEIATAASVPEALKHITSETYDVLLSDLHMPGAGDGLTVVSAMRHANPRAVTLLLTAFPEMGAAIHAILLQTDQILVKPMDLKALVDTIKQRLAHGPRGPHVVESVATILERSAQSIIDDWFQRPAGREVDGGSVELRITLRSSRFSATWSIVSALLFLSTQRRGNVDRRRSTRSGAA